MPTWNLHFYFLKKNKNGKNENKCCDGVMFFVVML